ncbi:MAG TPA: hypothetical protein VKA77_13270, partial [Mycobacterium sp.]|nr:hypothetical protein [Mycobacterium sp.]
HVSEPRIAVVRVLHTANSRSPAPRVRIRNARKGLSWRQFRSWYYICVSDALTKIAMLRHGGRRSALPGTPPTYG